MKSKSADLDNIPLAWPPFRSDVSISRTTAPTAFNTGKHHKLLHWREWARQLTPTNHAFAGRLERMPRISSSPWRMRARFAGAWKGKRGLLFLFALSFGAEVLACARDG